ncbi:unnamed protein product [Mucor hiemalis]
MVENSLVLSKAAEQGVVQFVAPNCKEDLEGVKKASDLVSKSEKNILVSNLIDHMLRLNYFIVFESLTPAIKKVFYAEQKVVNKTMNKNIHYRPYKGGERVVELFRRFNINCLLILSVIPPTTTLASWLENKFDKLVHFATERKDWIQQQQIHETWVQPFYCILHQHHNVSTAKQTLLYIATTPIAAEEEVTVDNNGKPDDDPIQNDIIANEAVVVEDNIDNVVKDAAVEDDDIADNNMEDGTAGNAVEEDDVVIVNDDDIITDKDVTEGGGTIAKNMQESVVDDDDSSNKNNENNSKRKDIDILPNEKSSKKVKLNM